MTTIDGITFGFQNDYTGTTSDGRNWSARAALLQYKAKSGEIYRLKLGATTDGPTDVPDPWFFGPLWECGAFHDGMYRDMVEVLGPDGNWYPWHPAKEQADALFLEMMESQGIGAIEREIIYKAVVLAGGKAFRDDRAAEHNPT